MHHRLPALAGILYVAVSLVAVAFEFHGPDVLDDPGEVVAHVIEGRGSVLTATTLLCVGQLLLVVFLVGVHDLLRRLQDDDRIALSGLVLGCV